MAKENDNSYEKNTLVIGSNGYRGVFPFVVDVKSTPPILCYLRGGSGGGPSVVEDLVWGIDYNISDIIVDLYPIFHPGSGQLWYQPGIGTGIFLMVIIYTMVDFIVYNG